ncbi:MAG: rhodanese-like domain-containing protein [Spirochaetia bacterium]|nr:rhodanese-like domain-containing protein [Spirochaetia bacterium]
MNGKANTSEVQAMIKNGALVVDVRTPGEFDSGHYPGALNIPHTEIGARLAELGAKDKGIVLYCRSGQRSGVALGIVSAAGFTKAVNAGGYVDMPKP